jgi:hypothetical protein
VQVSVAALLNEFLVDLPDEYSKCFAVIAEASPPVLPGLGSWSPLAQFFGWAKQLDDRPHVIRRSLRVNRPCQPERGRRRISLQLPPQSETFDDLESKGPMGKIGQGGSGNCAVGVLKNILSPTAEQNCSLFGSQKRLEMVKSLC